EIWEQLRLYQPEFRLYLYQITQGHVTPALMGEVTTRCNKARVISGWDDRAKAGYGGEFRESCYEEWLQVDDPVDGFYVELREFLRAGGAQRLKVCTVCQRFFVHVTTRVARFCSTSCRTHPTPERKARNKEDQRKHRKEQREMRIR